MFSLLSALPSPTTTLEQASVWANAFFGEFYWIIGITVGITFFGLVIPWLVKKITGGIANLVNGVDKYGNPRNHQGEMKHGWRYNPDTKTWDRIG